MLGARYDVIVYCTPRRDDGLTERQLSVLALWSSGSTHDEIGVALHMPTPTVRKDIYSLRETVGARSVTHAVAICVARGILFIDEVGDRVMVALAVDDDVVVVDAGASVEDLGHDERTGRIDLVAVAA